MIETLTAFFQGPVFVFSLSAAILGIGRLGFLHLHSIFSAIYKPWRDASDRLQFADVARRKIMSVNYRSARFSTSSATSIILAVIILIVAFLSPDHIGIIEGRLGVHLLALSGSVTFVLLCIAVVLIIGRIRGVFLENKRLVTGNPDLWFWSFVLITLVSGFGTTAVSVPGLLSFTRLVHVLSGDAFLLLIPFSRIGRFIVSPLSVIAGHFETKTLHNAPESDQTAEYYKKLSENPK